MQGTGHNSLRLSVVAVQLLKSRNIEQQLSMKHSAKWYGTSSKYQRQLLTVWPVNNSSNSIFCHTIKWYDTSWSPKLQQLYFWNNDNKMKNAYGDANTNRSFQNTHFNDNLLTLKASASTRNFTASDDNYLFTVTTEKLCDNRKFVFDTEIATNCPPAQTCRV